MEQYERIVREVHDRPHIRGTRVGVDFIRERVEGYGLEPETVARRHELDVTDVYLALAYYHDHPEEIRTVREQRRQREEAARADPTVATGPEDIPQ
jgi:uncharacterized protein (DUF433 family)